MLRLGAGLLIFCSLGLAILSTSLDSEVSSISSYLFAFYGLISLGFVGYFLGIRFSKGGQRELWLIGLVAILIRLIMGFSEPILETDPYRYIWDGQNVIHGISPYAESPQVAFEHGRIPGGEAYLEEKISIFRKINYRHIPTIYPAIAQYLFGISQWLSPWSLTGWRIEVFFAELGIIVGLALLLNIFKLPIQSIIIYAWNPLVIKEFSNSLHLDVFAILGCVWALYFWSKGKDRGLWLCLLFAVLIKWYAILLVPIFLAHQLSEKKGMRLYWPCITIVLAYLCYLPLSSSAGSIFDGTRAFAYNWQVNDSFFSIILVAYESFTWITNANFLARLSSALILVCIILFSSYRQYRNPDTQAGLRRMAGIILATFFLAPTGNPWYYLWVFPWLVIQPSRLWLLFSGLVFLYYVDFYCMQDMTSTLCYDLIRCIEYGILLAYFGYIQIWKNKKQKLASSSHFLMKLS
ncbi:MAG: alpha-1,6-mannosyltransferase [Candidatus Omnitrophota bacterium]|jgi:alpha-1,6-mannosyltransferase